MMATKLNDESSRKSPKLTSNDNLLDPALVQIIASKSQIEHRIEAFMQRKRIQADDTNRQLFCGSHQNDEDSSCARVNGVYGLARIQGSSHIKVSRIVNSHGPCILPYNSPVKVGSSHQPISQQSSDVEERLANMEAHLKITPDTGHTFPAGQTPMHIYERLKALEERILELESFSPEYMQLLPPPKSQRKRAGPLPTEESWTQKGLAADNSSKYQNMCLSEIDKRINSLREKLQKKKT